MLNRTNQRVNYRQYLQRESYQSDESPYYFAYGRTALKYGLMNLNLQNTTILVPEYICETVVDTLASLNISVIYYPVNNDLSPQWTALEALFEDKVKSILMVHYFGIPQAIVDFKAFCIERNIYLIEDNSHGCFGTMYGQLLGTFGDIGISSPRKSLPILNGGMLFAKNGIPVAPNLPVEPYNIRKAMVKNSIGKLLDVFPKIKARFVNNEGVNSNAEIQDWSIDKASYDLITKPNDYVQLRYSIYKIWEQWCVRNSLKPVFSNIPETVAPLCFPIICKTKEQKMNVMQFLNNNYIATFSWPDLPDNLKIKKNSGLELYNKIICLPVHTKISPATLQQKMEQFRVPLGILE